MTTETIAANPTTSATPATSVTAPVVPAAPATPTPATSPVTVNVSLGDLVARALNPEEPSQGTSETAAPTPETPPAVGVLEAPKTEVPKTEVPKTEDSKSPTKSELHAQVAKLESEKRCADVLEALRPKLAEGMDAVMKRLLPTLDLSTDEAVAATLTKLVKDMPALFAGPTNTQRATNAALFSLPAAGNKPAAPVMRRNR